MRSLHLALILAAGTTAAQPALSQPGQPLAIQPPERSHIVTTGDGEVTISPDRARINVAVETRGATAAAAAQENARIQQAVLQRLRGVGLPNNQLATVGYNVQPEYQYDRDGKPHLLGYVARNTVRADVHQLDQVGPAIDGALAAGANSIGSLDFYASNVDSARREALAAAVGNARADADAMARAAGGALGALIELSTAGSPPPPPMPMQRAQLMSATAAADTPINPGEETLRISVSATWGFTPR